MADRKQEFLARMNAELDSIDAQLDQYRGEQRDESTMGAKFRTDDTLAGLERRRDELRRRSRELEGAEGEAWDAARRDVERAREELRDSLDRNRDSLRH